MWYLHLSNGMVSCPGSQNYEEMLAEKHGVEPPSICARFPITDRRDHEELLYLQDFYEERPRDPTDDIVWFQLEEI